MKKVTVILFSTVLLIIMIFVGCAQKEEKVNANTKVTETSSVSVESTEKNGTSQTEQQSDAEKSEADSKETSQNSTTAKTTAKSTSTATTKKQTTTKKSTNQTTKKVTTTKKATTTTKVSRCTNNNNHSMPCGDMGKWFSSKSEVKSYVESIGAQWWNKYESGEITREEYIKNCPGGYECWSCGYCGKWTGNFKYR